MKIYFFTPVMIFCILVFSCENGVSSASCRAVLPELPAHWTEILGEAHWRLEWISTEGIWREFELAPGGESPELSLVGEWTSPVLAWPFWPARELYPGMMRPAGALFPWDCPEKKLILSWKSGVDAFFWKELASASPPSSPAANRLPWLFDWPRFRELMESGNIPDALRPDPWLADWKEIAQKTAESGFSSRRVMPRKFTGLLIPGADGRWTGSSPFSFPFESSSGGLLLNVTESPDTWVSAGGTLKCSASGWVFRGIEK